MQTNDIHPARGNYARIKENKGDSFFHFRRFFNKFVITLISESHFARDKSKYMQSKEDPLLSIIIPVYQVEKYLEACIESVLAQSFASFEVILVDDGSTDSCGAICDRFARQEPRIKVIHQTNRGLSGARNTGIEQAAGRYITFVDSDDTVSAGLYEKNMRLLLESDADLLEFPVHIYYGSPEEEIWCGEPEFICGDVFARWIRSRGYEHCYACNKIYKRTLFDILRFPEGKLFEDIYTIPSIMEKANSYLISGQGIYYYHAREGSISRQRNFEQYNALFDSYIRLWKMTKEKAMHPDAESIAMITANWLICMARKDRLMTNGIIKNYTLPEVSFRSLLRKQMPFRKKLKQIPLALFGMKSHYLLLSRILK
ncbi:MAG: glycosyltransferase family 2 protein [Bacteroidales bacterium]